MKHSFSREGWGRALLALLLLLPAVPAKADVWDRLQRLVNPEARGTQGQSVRTLTYTPASWPQALMADLYLPAPQMRAADAAPVVLLLHGGAWQGGDKASMRGLGLTLADRGYAALSINYRLAPDSRYPAQLQDVQQALRWVQQRASEYRLDTGRLAAWGYSAGGHLAALMAVQPASDLPPLRVVVAGGAPLDLRLVEAVDAPSVEAFLGGTAGQIPALYDQASPITYVRPGLPPFFLFHGSMDQLVPPLQSQVFADGLEAVGVPVELLWLQGLDHEEAGAAPQIRPAALVFLDRYLLAAPAGGAARWSMTLPRPVFLIPERPTAGSVEAGGRNKHG